MTWLGRVLLAVGLGLVVGFLLGRWSRGPVDTTLADAYAAERAGFEATIDTLESALTRARDSARADSVRADSVARRAGVALGVAARERARAADLARQVEVARTAADSLPLLVQQVEVLEGVADSLTGAAEGFKAAYDSTVAAFARFRVVSDSVTGAMRVRYEDRLVQADRVIADLLAQGKGCRVPVIGLRCPTVGMGYGVGADGKGRAVVAVVLPLR